MPQQQPQQPYRGLGEWFAAQRRAAEESPEPPLPEPDADTGTGSTPEGN